MASPRRNARTVVLTTCVLTTLAVPLTADAKPPEHVAADGQASMQGPARRPADATPPPHAAARGHAPRQQGGDRTTASATLQDSSTADGTGPGPGRARGHEHAPGQAKKDVEPARKTQAATDTAKARGKGTGASPLARPNEQATTSPSARRPEPATGAPAPGSGVEAGSTVAPTAPTQASAPAPQAQPPVPGPQGRRVWRLNIDGPFADLLEDVRTTIDRMVPQDLGPVREPLIRLVPVLLAILGAFLALQRGIGRGLGHIPMVASPALNDPPRRD